MRFTFSFAFRNAEDLKAQESKHRNYQRLLHSRSEVDKRREILKHRLNAKAKTLQTQASVKQRRDHFEYSKFVLQTVHTDLQNTSQLNVSQKNVNQFLHQIQDAIRSADFVFAEADLDSIDTQYNVFVKTTGLELEMVRPMELTGSIISQSNYIYILMFVCLVFDCRRKQSDKSIELFTLFT